MGNYLVFAMTQEKTSTFYIDDIEITESSCRSARPTLSKLTHNSVRLAYSAEPTTMRVVLAKDYVFDADSLNAGAQSIDNLKEQGLVVLDTLLADKMSVQLQDLVSNTNYSAALLTLCDEDVSSWETTAWQTMCAPYSLAEVELIDFEEYNSTTSNSVTYYPIPCWVTGNKAVIPTAINIPYVLEGTVAPQGSKSLKFYTTEHQNGAYAIMPALDVDDITKYELTFLGRAMDASTATAPSTIKEISDYAGAIIVGILTDPADLSTFEAVDTIVLPDNAVHLCKVRFNMYQGDVNEDYGKYVAFMSEFDKENYFYVDNISIA